MWMILFLLLPLSGLAYTLWHVWCVLPFSVAWKWAVISVLTLCFLLLFVNLSRVLDRLPMPLAVASYEVGCSSIIVLLYLVMIFLVLDLGRLCRLIPREVLHANGFTTCAILLVMVGIFTAGYIHYLDKKRQPIALKTEKPLARDLKIVMMSDLHLGYHNRRAEFARWVDMVNAEAPDLILIGGDIIDNSLRPLMEEGMAEEFQRLEAPIYACLGNHEYYASEPKALQFYRQAGITLLRDSVATVGDLCLVGRDDRTNPRRQSLAALMQKADRSKYVILLDHQPYHLEEAEQQGVDFQFSGHTHDGQVWPISWVTRSIYEDAFGPHVRGNTHYYVSSGIGIWGGKFRIGTRSEYVVATLTK